MSVDLRQLDLAMPDLSEGSPEEKIDRMGNYLVLLSEQLRYTVGSMGAENFSDAGLRALSGVITGPLLARMEDSEGRLAALALTAEALTLRMENAEGSVSTLTQTAEGLTARVSGAEGNITTLSQTVYGLSVTAENGTESSRLTLSAGGTVLSSATVRISGMVKFSDLSGAGSSTINGSNITTGTISAITMKACTFQTLLSGGQTNGQLECYYGGYGTLAGGLRLDDEGTGTEARYRMFLYTNYVDGIAFALKLQSAGGMSLYSMTNMYIRSTADMTLVSDFGDLNIIAPLIRPAIGGTAWSFRADGIYYGDTRKVAV